MKLNSSAIVIPLMEYNYKLHVAILCTECNECYWYGTGPLIEDRRIMAHPPCPCDLAGKVNVNERRERDIPDGRESVEAREGRF